MSQHSHIDDAPADPEFRLYEQRGEPICELPDGTAVHSNQLIVVTDSSSITQDHYYAVADDPDRDGIRVRETGTHDFEHTMSTDRLASDDVEVVTCEDGTPVWGY